MQSSNVAWISDLMSTVVLPLDCRSCWQYLRKLEVLPVGLYVVPFEEGQPRTVRAAAVVVGVLTDDVDEVVEVVEDVVVEEIDVDDAEELDADETGDEVDCAETEDVDEAGSGVPEV